MNVILNVLSASQNGTNYTKWLKSDEITFGGIGWSGGATISIIIKWRTVQIFFQGTKSVYEVRV